jgi:hypothetical protein
MGIGAHDQQAGFIALPRSRSKSQTAWETAARCALQAQETDDLESVNIMRGMDHAGEKDASLT